MKCPFSWIPFFVLNLLVIPGLTTAQQIDEGIPPPQIIDPGNIIPPRDLGLILDTAPGLQVGNSAISISVVNGVKTIDVVEVGLKVHIEDDPNTGIRMRITRHYGPQDIESLVDSQPELYMHLKAMPTEVGDAKIEISVGVTREYEADNADDLAERYPEAHDLYQKYSSAQAPDLRRRLEIMPVPRAIRPFDRGMRLQIDPDRVRVHEEEKDDTEQDDNGEQKETDKDRDK